MPNVTSAHSAELPHEPEHMHKLSSPDSGARQALESIRYESLVLEVDLEVNVKVYLDLDVNLELTACFWMF